MSPNRKHHLSRFYFLRFEAGFVDVAQAAELFGVCKKTIRNWDKQGAPVYAERLLYALSGDLGNLFPEWKGFRLGRDYLSGPGRLRLRPEDVKGWWSMRDIEDRRRIELERLQASWLFCVARSFRLLGRGLATRERL